MNAEVKNVTIKSECLSVEISTSGAELSSVKLFGKERLWQGDPAFWTGRAPILFPVCGTLKNDCYEYGGKRYEMKRHGFARRFAFKVESVQSDRAVLVLEANDETKKQYPFDFLLRVEYKAIGSKLCVGYEIKNRGDEDMWAFIGSHESYLLDDVLEKYRLVFENDERFLSRTPTKDGLVDDSVDDFGSGKVLCLNDRLFDCDTVILAGISSRKVSLCKGDKPVAAISFDAENLLVWTKVGAPYVCIEPWLNLPDEADCSGNILDKKGISIVKSGESFFNEHEIEYFEV